MENVHFSPRACVCAFFSSDRMEKRSLSQQQYTIAEHKCENALLSSGVFFWGIVLLLCSLSGTDCLSPCARGLDHFLPPLFVVYDFPSFFARTKRKALLNNEGENTHKQERTYKTAPKFLLEKYKWIIVDVDRLRFLFCAEISISSGI